MVVEAQKSDKRRCGAWSAPRHLAEYGRVQPVLSSGEAEAVRLHKGPYSYETRLPQARS